MEKIKQLEMVLGYIQVMIQAVDTFLDDGNYSPTITFLLGI